MNVTYRPINVWPEGWQHPERDRTRIPPQFSAPLRDTLRLLDVELRALAAEEAVIQIDIRAKDVRNDGALRADIPDPKHPGVILTAETKHGSLIYASDRFVGRQIWRRRTDFTASHYEPAPGWQMNLRAIALGLDALRKIDRYGIAEHGQQYAGYRAIGTGIELHAAPMTVEAAATELLIAARSGPELAETDVIDNPGLIADLYRAAVIHHHPDRGGNPDDFRRATEARDILRADYRRRHNLDANGSPR